MTGSSGFVGSTVAHLVATAPELSEWRLIGAAPGLDLRNAPAVHAWVEHERPDAVLHLAAQSWVPDSFRDPEGTLAVNVLGTLHLLEALKRAGFTGRMLYVSTGDVYGLVPTVELPITESRLPRPRNPYAVSKLAAEALCGQWAITEHIDIIVARPFNHIGPGQSPRFVVSDLCRQFAEIAAGTRPPALQAGDVDVTRDFTDVRDVVRAYFDLLDRGARGEVYNVCSGREQSIRDIIERLSAVTGSQPTLEQDPTRVRPAEQRRVRGDASKLRVATGWSPAIPLDESLRGILHDWQSKVAQ